MKNPSSGEVTIGMSTLLTMPSIVERAGPGRHDRRAEEAADQRVAARARQALLPGDQVPR